MSFWPFKPGNLLLITKSHNTIPYEPFYAIFREIDWTLIDFDKIGFGKKGEIILDRQCVCFRHYIIQGINSIKDISKDVRDSLLNPLYLTHPDSLIRISVGRLLRQALQEDSALLTKRIS